MTTRTHLSSGLRGGLVAAALVALAAGCATTQQAKVGEKAEQSACAFLSATVCGELTPTETPGRLSGAAITGSTEHALAGRRYVDPSAQWTQYSKVIVAPVTFWGDDDSNVSQGDQQKLSDYFHQAIEKDLATKFEVVQEPGPGVMTVQVALVDADSATPVLRTISMLIPQARALATLVYLAKGSYAFVGSATAEVKVVDSQTGQVLAAAVDKRIGGGSIKTAAQWEWGDAENAMKTWAQQLTDRLAAWTSGKETS